MKKKIFTVVTALLAVCASLTACGNKDNNVIPEQNETPIETSTDNLDGFENETEGFSDVLSEDFTEAVSEDEALMENMSEAVSDFTDKAASELKINE